jgi:diguanylate cyclase (GGDEF)-like protein
MSPLPTRRPAFSRAAALLAQLALLLMLQVPAQAAEQPTLQLGPGVPAVQAWPAITLLSDPALQLTADEAVARLDEFRAPPPPYANLGPRRDAVWLQLRADVAADDGGDWLLDIDYPPLDRVDVYVVRSGHAVHLGTLGDTVPTSQRPLATRAHTMPLQLQAGQSHQLLLRVVTRSAMVLPARLIRAQAWQATEARVQMVQGLMAGLGLCLVLYSLAQWISLRDRMFLQYAAMVSCTTVFFFALNGLAAQHLWPGHPWLVDNAPVVAVMLALGAGFIFLERALGVSQLNRSMGRAMQLGAGLAFGAVMAFVAGWIDFRVIQTLASVMGPLTILMGAQAAMVRSRAGDGAARCILVAWSAYAVGAIIGVGLLRGLLPSNDWTRHALQAGSMVESIGFMLVLGVRMEQTRQGARRAHAESDVLRRLAHSDPLTGLRNRRGLSDVLQARLASCRTEQAVAIYLLDVDGFKQVNDRRGHDAGDELLVALATRLRLTLDAQAIVARLGGDEFVVVADRLTGAAAAQAIGQALLDAARLPFDLASGPCQVSLTVGYALAPQDGRDASLLLRRADAAMYVGKQTGRNCLYRDQKPAALVAA